MAGPLVARGMLVWYYYWFIRGRGVALRTPFWPEGNADLGERHRSQHLLLEAGVDALGLVGTTALLAGLGAEQVARVRGTTHHFAGTGHLKALGD